MRAVRGVCRNFNACMLESNAYLSTTRGFMKKNVYSSSFCSSNELTGDVYYTDYILDIMCIETQWMQVEPPEHLNVGIRSVQGRRSSQEDKYAAFYFLRNPVATVSSETHFFGVFDGHAGPHCSLFIHDELPRALSHHKTFVSSLPDAFREACDEVNERFLRIDEYLQSDAGSSAVMAALRGRMLTIANVGDSRAIVTREDGSAVVITQDHKPALPTERKRIESFGGRVIQHPNDVPRAAGYLAMSRAFGNLSHRDIIRPDADITEHEITATDQYLVLASDGLWDVMSNEQVAKICSACSTNRSTQEIADHLIQKALPHSWDNITAVVVDLRTYLNKMIK